MTGTVQNNIITVRQGDSFALNLEIKDGCTPVDLTGATITMQVRDTVNGNILFGIEATPVDALNGKAALLITPSETSNPVGDYVTDIQLTGADGSVNTIFPADVNKIGVFRITAQVTEV
jgi:hypothetical protein